jgi:tRNA-dihydrouridine synthase B
VDTSPQIQKMYSLLAQNSVFLAPMAGVTDSCFRALCCAQGAGLAYTEMVSAKGLDYQSIHTERLLQLGTHEKQVAVQLFGDEPLVIARQAAHLTQTLGNRLALIDLNMGCPVPKVVRKGAGAALMQSPELARKIVYEAAVATDKPVTVKFRRGYQIGDDTCETFARSMESGGAAALTVHGRYAMQYYKGTSDPDVIKRIKACVDIPVIASGDLFEPSDVAHMFYDTLADGVMLARGARGNPWLFARTHALLQGDNEGANKLPTLEERIETARLHARGLAALDDRLGTYQLLRMRQQVSWYFKGIFHATVYRAQANECSTLEDFEAFFDRMSAQILCYGEDG